MNGIFCITQVTGGGEMSAANRKEENVQRKKGSEREGRGGKGKTMDVKTESKKKKSKTRKR